MKLSELILKRQRLNRRIKLPGDLYEVTTRGAWIKTKCTLPQFIEGQARQTHMMVDGTVYRLHTWEEMEQPFSKRFLNAVMVTWHLYRAKR